MHDEPAERDRGRSAQVPQEIPKPGWRDVLLRVKASISDDNLSITAAGTAFYLFLAVFPGLAALVSLYGLLADPVDVQNQINSLVGILPRDALATLNQQLTSITSHSGSALSLGFVSALLLTLWSATGGVKALITALNIAYHEHEKRGFIRLNLTAIGLTISVLLFFVFALMLVVVMPIIFNFIGLGWVVEIALRLLRWPLLAGIVMVLLAVLYRYAPSRGEPRWSWVSTGAVVATLMWVAGSLGFSFYVENFANYNKTYGSLGAVVILLMWFYYSAFIILLGAELNAEMEHQTAKDTTTGKPQPMGERDAYVADTLGKVP
ncbi:YihY/virulence factor BrkB family protein [Thermithiobacillus plumbiphilus]|uniref:YihY/virulence factor BrkB family protein n=1 Tax=Thermithiobacillus plumbiphilus TaxID=1729899 RepID=A0ABU9DA51_9PROT